MEMRLHNRMVSINGTAAEIATVLESIAWRVLLHRVACTARRLRRDDRNGLVSIWDDE